MALRIVGEVAEHLVARAGDRQALWMLVNTSPPVITIALGVGPGAFPATGVDGMAGLLLARLATTWAVCPRTGAISFELTGARSLPEPSPP